MEASESAIVRFIGVEKTFDGEVMAVTGLNLDVRQREFLTLLGPSGSGKTTTLMMLAGFETPTSGDILLNGRSITRVPAYKRDIGVVFQNYALFPHMSVGENIAFPLRARHFSSENVSERVERALSLVRLGGLAHRHPNQLSGGQQQRAALARALVFEPKLILMDEPLGALDRQLRETMQYEIKQLHRSLGVTVLYVTHDQVEALTMSDRIAVFNGGSIQQLATAASLYDEPDSAFVAQFIGESNRLSGIVRAIEGSTCVIDSCGTSIVAKKIGDLTVGRKAVVVVRPERIALNPNTNDLENSLDGVVREHIYHGDTIRVRVAIGENEHFIVKVPVGQFNASCIVGQSLKLGWPVRYGRAFTSTN